MAHATITEGSTLGVVALMCGLTQIYGSDGVEPSLSKRYLDLFIPKCWEVQEGVATAVATFQSIYQGSIGVASLSREEIVFAVDPSYLLASSWVTDILQ